MSKAARGRWWCSSCSTSRIRRSSWKPGRTASEQSRVVFITRNISEAQVRGLFVAVAGLVYVMYSSFGCPAYSAGTQ